MKNTHLDLYADYLLCSFTQTTATGLSAMVDGEVSHDKITRFLSNNEFTSSDLWLRVKSTVREIGSDDGVLIFDDTIQEKNWTDESELVCWHFDHCKNRSVKGVNILNAVYHSNNTSVPVGYDLITKPIHYCDVKTKKRKRKSEITKNQRLRAMLAICIQNSLKFKFVLCDSWFTSLETLEFIRTNEKHCIGALKSNRLIALSEEDKKNKRFTRIDNIHFPEQTAVQGWLKGYDEPVLLVRQVFTNKDGSTGILYLVCTDLTCNYDTITTTYKKRWEVEVFHKSLKSNANLGKSPTKRIRTQSNHIFMSFYAAFKLQCLSIKSKLNPFSLQRKLLINANRAAYEELDKLNREFFGSMRVA